MERKHVLLATLGGQPQVVTFTLDLLLDRFPITDVIVVHPRAAQARLQHSLACLQAEFNGDYYRQAGRIIHFRSQVLQYDGKPMDDIVDDDHADGTLDTLHHLLGELKRQDYCIHLSVSGGRRLMALLATSVAILNFDRHDSIWHIYTPQEIKERAADGKIMHVPTDAGVKLIRAPFPSLGAYTYASPQSFQRAQQEQRLQMDAQQRATCKSVVEQCTPQQLKVLRAFSQGLKPQQVAKQLSVEISTVNSHKTAILQYCRNAWNIASSEQLNYYFLHTKFADYFDNDG
ncbi:CRISPR-associated ring nuclease [Ktedonosporobacter rubrisoli]|uniref:CRISPR-associated ring nuclease n=1 Tax=Ktedonosporobacter rubrisoli TaxID=2509675 RepID=UPI0013EED11D|nr:CRISPR-associated ring nuclease [Ktedonosporobacter rubrisoli]